MLMKIPSLQLYSSNKDLDHLAFFKNLKLLARYLYFYSGRVLRFHIGLPCLHPSVCPYFCFRMITWVNVNLVCALILWRSGLGLVMGKFHQFLTALSARQVWFFISIYINGFSPNLVYAMIFQRSGLGLLMGKFYHFLTNLSARDMYIFVLGR